MSLVHIPSWASSRDCQPLTAQIDPEGNTDPALGEEVLRAGREQQGAKGFQTIRIEEVGGCPDYSGELFICDTN